MNIGLYGRAGAGKSSTTNKLCGTTRRADFAFASLTMDLGQYPVNVGPHNFYLVDSPAANSRQKVLQHAASLYTMLTLKPLNAIALVVKFGSRADEDLCAPIEGLLQPIMDYKHKVVVMVSHCDSADFKASNATQIANMIRSADYGCDLSCDVIFYSNKSCAVDVASALWNAASSYPAEKLQIEENSFYARFNLAQGIVRSINQDYKNACQELNTKFTSVRALLNEFPTVPTNEKDDFLHSIMVQFTMECETLRTNFQDNNRERMDQTSMYCTWMCLQRTIHEYCDSLSELIAQLMDEAARIRQNFKRCPNCGIPWVKVAGCDSVTCGTRPSSATDDIVSWTRFEYFYDLAKRQLSWRRKGAPPPKKAPTPLHPASNQVKGWGCGTAFNFAMQPPLTQAEINDLIGTTSEEMLRAMAIQVKKDLPQVSDLVHQARSTAEQEYAASHDTLE